MWTASQLYDENTLNDLMETTVFNDISIRKSEIEDLWVKAFDNRSISFHMLLHYIIFSRPGRDFVPLNKIPQQLITDNYSRQNSGLRYAVALNPAILFSLPYDANMITLSRHS